MAIQSITKPMALDETLQSTNTALGGVAKDTTLQSTNGKMDSVITKLQGIIDALGIKTSVYKAGGDKTCAELVPALLIEDYCGYVYNITDTGATTSDFVEGAGKPINIGDNVGIVDRGTGGNHVYKFDLMAGMVDLTDYIKKSSTSGFVKNDGTIDTTTYQPTEAGKGLSSNDYTSAEKTKLAGIATGATKTEASTTNGNVKINGTETQVYNDEEIQGKLTTDTATSTGNPINFTTKSAQNAESTIIDLEPMQDLHGYDKPWVGGAGKNKLALTVNGIKTANSDVTWTGNSTVINNVTFTILTDNDGNVTGIKANGIANGSISLYLVQKDISNIYNGYILNCANITSSSQSVAIQYYSNGTIQGSYILSSSGDNYTVTNSGTNLRLLIRIENGQNVNNLVFQPMLRLSTETDPIFAPYTNICPISGRSEIGIEGCGKNLLSGIENGAWNTSTQTKTTNTNRARSNQVIQVVPNTTYRINATTVSKTINCSINYYTGTGAGTYINSSGWQNINYSFTTPNNCRYITIIYATQSGSDANPEQYISNAQLELGSSATNYSPYTSSNNIAIAFGETVYGGSLDVGKGVLRVDKKIISLSDLEWGLNGSSPNQFFATIYEVVDFKQGYNATEWNESNNLLCSSYNKASLTELTNGCIRARYTGTDQNPISTNRLVIKDDRYNDTTTFVNGMGSTQICYELATPTVIQLTPYQISLLKGVNNISVSDDYSEITLTYRSGEVATLGDLLDTENKMLAKQHNYSTDEQVVGTSDDGRPLYEKTLNLNATQIADNNYSDSDIEYADQFNIVSGYYVISGAYGNISLGLNSYESSSLYTRTGFRMYNKTLFTVTNGYTAVSAKIIIQYTKST